MNLRLRGLDIIYHNFIKKKFSNLLCYLKKKVGLGKKSESEEPNRTRSEKVVPNPNRN